MSISQVRNCYKEKGMRCGLQSTEYSVHFNNLHTYDHPFETDKRN